MPARRTVIVPVCVLLTAALTAGLYAQRRPERPRTPSRRPAPRPTAEPGEKPSQPTRLQIDLFELVCTSDRLIRLNVDQLQRDRDGGKGLSSTEVLKQLGELGTARLLLRIDNVVDRDQRQAGLHSHQRPADGGRSRGDYVRDDRSPGGDALARLDRRHRRAGRGGADHAADGPHRIDGP